MRLPFSGAVNSVDTKTQTLNSKCLMQLMRGRAATHLFCDEFESQANSDDNELVYTTTYIYCGHTANILKQLQSWCRVSFSQVEHDYATIVYSFVYYSYINLISYETYIFTFFGLNTFRLLVKTQHENHTPIGSHATNVEITRRRFQTRARVVCITLKSDAQVRAKCAQWMTSKTHTNQNVNDL